MHVNEPEQKDSAANSVPNCDILNYHGYQATPSSDKAMSMENFKEWQRFNPDKDGCTRVKPEWLSNEGG